MELIKRNPRTAWRGFGENMVVITPDDSMIHKLNESATFVWQTVGEKGVTSGKLLDMMDAEYRAPRETIEKDLEELLADVTAKKILIRVEGQESPA